MRTKFYIALSTPKDYYFLNLPVEAKCNLPGSSVYNFVEFQNFLGRLIEKFPGNVRDLSGSVGIQPHVLFAFAHPNPDIKVHPTFSDLIAHEAMGELIKLYYKHVLSANPTNTSDQALDL